jgi:hypothetical protein
MLTPEEIESWLTYSDNATRLKFATRTDFTPTPAQIERGLTDSYAAVRYAFAKRDDFTPTPEQFERGLTDKFIWVRISFAERADCIPSLEQFERGVKDDHPGVLEAFLKNPNSPINYMIAEKYLDHIDLKGRENCETAIIKFAIKNRMKM